MENLSSECVVRAHRKRRRFQLAIAVVVGLANGCAAEFAEDRVDVGAADEALFVEPGVKFWPGGNVPVCFGFEQWEERNGVKWRIPTPATNVHWEQAARFQQVLEQQIHRPGIAVRFTGFQACQDEFSGTAIGQMRIVLRNGSDFAWGFRHCTFDELYVDGNGDGKPDGCGGGTGFTNTEEATILTTRDGYSWGTHYDSMILHETLHALGFKHEWDRQDVVDCAAQDGAAATSPPAVFLTNYDPGSVLNASYCDIWPGALSELDVLGLEIVYPASTTHPMLARGGFVLSDGSLVVRQNDELVTDWTHRGAHPRAFSHVVANQPAIAWRNGSATIGTRLTQPVSGLGTGVHTLSGSYTDFRSRDHTIASRRVNVNDALHTAILMSTIGS